MADFSMQEIATWVFDEARKQGIDPKTALAIITAENTADGVFKPEARVSLGTTSNKGAVGIGQVMPATLQGLKDKGFLPADHDYGTPQGQIAASVAALKELTTRYGTDPLRLAVGYNASSKANALFDSTGKLPAETATYRQKVARFLGMADSTDTTTPAGTGSDMVSSSERSGSSVSRKQYDSGLLQSAVGAQDALYAMMTRALGLQQDIVNNQTLSTEEAKAALDRAAGASGTVSDVKATIENAQDDQRRRAAGYLGMTMGDDTRLAQANRQIAVADQLLSQLNPEMDKLMAADITKDPLNWLVSQFKLVSVQPRVEQITKQKDQAIATILHLQQAADNQAKLEPAVINEQRMRLVKAETDLAATHATLQKQALDEKLASKQISLLGTEVQYGTMTAESAYRRAEMMVQHITDTFSQTDKAAKEVDTLMLKQINIGALLVGKKPIESMAAVKLMNPDMRSRLQLLGSQEDLKLGGSFGKAVETLEVTGAIKHYRDQHPTMMLFLDSVLPEARRRAEEAAAKDPAFAKLKLKDQITTQLDLMDEEWRKEYASTTADKLREGNPFKMSARTYASAPELSTNTLAKYVNTLTANDPRIKIDDKFIAKYALDQIAAGKPSAMVANEMADFYRIGSKHQADVRGLHLFSISIQDPTSNNGDVTYRVSRDVASSARPLWDSASKRMTFDFMKPVDVTRYLIMEQANRAYFEDPLSNLGAMP